MNNFEAAIFDMDGLLLDSEKLAYEAFKNTCMKLKTGDLSELFIRCIGTNAELGASIFKWAC